MHILIMNWRDPKHPRAGGAEIVTLEHAKRWVRAGHEVTWLTAWFRGVPQDEIADGIHFVRRGGSMTVYLAVPIYYLLHRKEFSVIVDEIHGLPFFTPLYTRKPKIAFIHEIAKEIWGYMAPFPLNIIGRVLEPMYLLLYRSIIFWTDAQSTVNELVASGIPKKNCIAIPCPVSNPIVKTFPEKAKKPTFLYVSRIVKIKGVEDVLQSFFLIKKQLPNAEFWVVGEGFPDYTNSIINMADDLDLGKQITFFGKVNETKKLELMGKSHLLIHASIREGWGLVVLEAASQGTPSVVYDVPGLRDVANYGKTGVIVKENTPEHLASESITLYKDHVRYKKLQTAAFQWVRSLSWDKSAKQSLDLLKKIAR